MQEAIPNEQENYANSLSDMAYLEANAHFLFNDDTKWKPQVISNEENSAFRMP